MRHQQHQALSRPDERYPTAITLAFLSLLVVGTNPFPEVEVVAISSEGDPVRQTLLVGLFLLSIPVFIARRRQIAQIILSAPSFLLLMAWCIFSVFWSDVADFAIRRLIGTMLAAGLTLVASSLSPSQLIAILLIGTGTVMVVDYLGLYLVSERALDHEGSWKGLHMHKNIAGCFSAVAALLWLFVGYARRTGWLITGGIAWALYSWFTGSKTSFGMLLAVIPIGLMFNWGLKRGFDRRLLIFLLLASVVLLPPITMVILACVELMDLTFTGRTEIWTFVWDSVLQTPLLGVGYGSFWAVGDTSASLVRANEWVAQYSEGHNGYLDVLVTVGFVGLCLTLAAFGETYRKLSHYSAPSTDAATREVLLCAFVSLTFGILHNSLELTLLQGLNPLWTLMLSSIWVINSTISTNRESYHARADT